MINSSSSSYDQSVQFNLTGHIASASIFVRFSQAGQCDLRYGVVRPLGIVRIALQILEQVRFEYVGRFIIGGQNGHQTPAFLAAVSFRALIIRGLLHYLTVDLVAQLGMMMQRLQQKVDAVDVLLAFDQRIVAHEAHDLREAVHCQLRQLGLVEFQQ